MDIELYDFLISEGKFEDAERYRIECNQEEWDALGDPEEEEEEN